jgi:Icc-related predicted phosphoesterase
MSHIVQDTLFSLLFEDSSKVAEDELFSAFSEKVAEDAKSPENMTLQEHDKIHHKNGFDPETMTCKFREKMKKITDKDAADLIYATSDIHMSGIESITDKECGTIILAGDFMEKAKKKENIKDAEKWWEDKFLPWCEDHKDQNIVIIGGNCDKWLYYNRDKVEWPKNVHYLDDTETEVNGMKVYGTSWCPHNMNGAWEVDNEQLEKEFAKIPEGLDILVTHVPPKGEGLDLDHDTEFNNHFGSEALTKAILEKKPKIVLCGHVHSGSHKPTMIGDSLVMNVSRIDDDRYEQSFHGRRIGVERTDNGLGFLVDMDDTGKIDLGKKEDVPKSILEMRNALREAAKSIGGHIDSKDFTPDQDKIARAQKAIEDAKGELEKFDHPKKRMLEATIQNFMDSMASGWRKPMSRIGKLYEGDDNGKPKFSYIWEPHGAAYKGGLGGGDSYASTIADYWASFGIGKKHSYSDHTNRFGKYKDIWKGGMGADEILKKYEEKDGVKKVELEPDEIEDPRYDEFGLLKPEYRKNKGGGIDSIQYAPSSKKYRGYDGYVEPKGYGEYPTDLSFLEEGLEDLPSTQDISAMADTLSPIREELKEKKKEVAKAKGNGVSDEDFIRKLDEYNAVEASIAKMTLDWLGFGDSNAIETLETVDNGGGKANETTIHNIEDILNRIPVAKSIGGFRVSTMPINTRGFCAGGKIACLARDASLTSYIHEFGHIFCGNEEINKICDSFFHYRTKEDRGYRNITLGNTVVAQGRYKGYLKRELPVNTETVFNIGIEVAKPDKFWSDYCGRAYLKREVGISGTNHWYPYTPKLSSELKRVAKSMHGSRVIERTTLCASEIMSMGLERLLYEPDKFLKQDPEYACLIITLLKGDKKGK